MDSLKLPASSLSDRILTLPLSINLTSMTITTVKLTSHGTQTMITFPSDQLQSITPNRITDSEFELTLLLYLHHDTKLSQNIFNNPRAPGEILSTPTLYHRAFDLLLTHPKFTPKDLMHKPSLDICQLFENANSNSSGTTLAKLPPFCITYGTYSLMKDPHRHMTIGILRPNQTWTTCCLPLPCMQYLLYVTNASNSTDLLVICNSNPSLKIFQNLLFRKFIQTCLPYPPSSALFTLSSLVMKRPIKLRLTSWISHIRSQSHRILHAALLSRLQDTDRPLPLGPSLLNGTTKISPLWIRDDTIESYFEVDLSAQLYTSITSVPISASKLLQLHFPNLQLTVPPEIWQRIAKDLLRSLACCSCTYSSQPSPYRQKTTVFLCPPRFKPTHPPWSFCKLIGIIRIPKLYAEPHSIPGANESTLLSTDTDICSPFHYPFGTFAATSSYATTSPFLNVKKLAEKLRTSASSRLQQHTPCHYEFIPNNSAALVTIPHLFTI